MTRRSPTSDGTRPSWWHLRLATEPFDGLYVSTLQRTGQTAAPLVARSGMTPVVDPDLREIFLGEWEGGLLRQKAHDRDPVIEQVWREERWDVIPGAESREVFGGRLRHAIERIAAAHPGGRVVVFSHGAAIGEILAQASGSKPFAFLNADNASISRSGGRARSLDRAQLQRHGPPGGVGRGLIRQTAQHCGRGRQTEAPPQAEADPAAGARLRPLHRRRQALLAPRRPAHPRPRGRGQGGAAQAPAGASRPLRPPCAGWRRNRSEPTRV